MADDALYELKDSIGTITLNRPERMNSLSGQMMDLTLQYLRQASTDPDVRCVVLTGAGDRAFSAGADLKARGERRGGGSEGPTLEQSIDGLQRQQEASVLLHTMPKPTVAAINGAAAGASLSMAFASDFRLAAEGAVLRTAFSGIGFSGDFGSSYFLTNMVGSAKARELMLLGEKISAEDAHAMGLVNRVFSRDTFRKDVNSFAERLAEGPPLSYRYMKRNINLAEAGGHLRDVLDLEAESMTRTGRSEDLTKATQSFLKKEKAAFKGR
jgi:2-(1,2-epoxy-1,2-dihydrophenyl)acetyl-CoA isomerase